MNIVSTNIPYNYDVLKKDISSLLYAYPFLENGIIGYSVLGKPIPYIRLGIGKKEVFYSASFHANEWITSIILMKFIENYCSSYLSNSSIYNYKVKDIFNSCSIYIVPMVNPDGIDLVTNNLDSASYNLAKSISNKFPSIPFPSGWKANITGMDLKIYQPVCKAL